MKRNKARAQAETIDLTCFLTFAFFTAATLFALFS